MDEHERQEWFVTDVADAMEDVVLGFPKDATSKLQGLDDTELKATYKASKQLSDLCWQEIQRRRREAGYKEPEYPRWETAE